MSDRLVEKLAIFNQLPEIVKLIETNEITYVFVDTGCGKSIGIPWALIRKEYCSNNKGYRIICTQPTITAAISLCEFQTKLSPKFKVGYAAEGDRIYDKSTNAIYATAGHIRKIMEKYFADGKASDMNFCDYLMIDEIHGGTKDNSVIIYLWLEAKRQGVKVPRLILSTATDPGLESVTRDIKGAVFRSDFRHFPVKVRYHGKNYEPDSDDIYGDIAKVAVDLFLETKSHGIIFLPGAAEVEDAVIEIQAEIKKRGIDKQFNRPIRVLPCYAQCKREDVLLAVRDEEDPNTEDPCFKFVVSTNLVETSLTIPNVGFIADTLFEKRVTTVSGRSHLATTRISKNSADQRKGRTGRTKANGICYRMCQERFYNEFEDTRPAEILRTPICDVALGFYGIGLDPEIVVTELDIAKLIEAKKILVETGCIVYEQSPANTIFTAGKMRQSSPFKIRVTPIGMFVKDIPMDVRNAVTLYLYINGNASSRPVSVIEKEIADSTSEFTRMIESDTIADIYKLTDAREKIIRLATEKESSIDKIALSENVFWAILAVVIADTYGPPLFWFPRKNKDEKYQDYRERIEAHKDKYFKEFESKSPLLSMMYAVKDMFDEFPDTNLNTSPFKTKRWCGDRCINNKKMREIVVQVKRIQRILYDMYGSKNHARFSKPKTTVSKPIVVAKEFVPKAPVVTPKTTAANGWESNSSSRQMRAKARPIGDKSMTPKPITPKEIGINPAPIKQEPIKISAVESKSMSFADAAKSSKSEPTLNLQSNNNDDSDSDEYVKVDESLFKENFVCLYHDTSDIDAAKCISKLTMCFKKAYSGILIENRGQCAVSHDSRIVQIDTMKTVSSICPVRGNSTLKASEKRINIKTAGRGMSKPTMTSSIMGGKISASDMQSGCPIKYIPISEIQIKGKKATSLIISLWIPLYEPENIPDVMDIYRQRMNYGQNNNDGDMSDGGDNSGGDY